MAGDQVPSEDRGEKEDEEAGEYMAKLCLYAASRVGDVWELNERFSSSIGTTVCLGLFGDWYATKMG